MIPKSTYQRKLFFYFLTVFLVFTSVITIIQYNREKEFKAKELKAILETYSDFVYSFATHNQIGISNNYSKLDSIKSLFPRQDIRITIVGLYGKVLYDSFYKNYGELINHIDRPEIQQALFAKTGSNVRLSESTNQNFFYFAKKYDQFFIRTAVVYSVSIKEFLSVDTVFWFFIAILFLITSSVLLFVSDTVGKSIVKLKDFAVKAARNESIDMPVDFPDNELGEIGNQIVSIYHTLNKTNKQLSNEKEKLINHIQISKEGVAIFSLSDEKIISNSTFVQYLNLISDSYTIAPDQIFELEDFIPLKEFVVNYSKENNANPLKTLPVKRISVSKGLRNFEVQCIIFPDKSYEIAIADVTQAVLQRKMKQEMTSNIAHELRTPVSSIKGYLETIINCNDMPIEKQRYFIQRAALQTDRLSDLIKDISELTKIEESSELYQHQELELRSLVDEVIENLQSRIDEVKANVVCNIDKSTRITGNRALIFSVFQNLIENSLNYAGQNITITINEFQGDNEKVNISFADNGVGIEEEHHARIFERFYRVDKGRDRGTGGTGLGLAIVKNAIELHGNKIMVKNRKGGGAEFLFSLNKYKG
jgi:two-component system OmpR family sensor kinase/two-component system phosphate regulon sensor histidine kinase PhoR